MTHHLAFRCVVEGSTDRDFFDPLMPRALAELAYGVFEPPVQVDFDSVDLLLLDDESRQEAIVRRVRDDLPWVTAVFLHYDATTQRDREHGKYFAPVASLWPFGSADAPLLLPLAPEREMEAWALADLPALRAITRSSWTSADVYEGHLLDRVERLTDPKQTLQSIFDQGVRSRGQRMLARDYLPLLGQRISLESLAEVPSFAAWQAETQSALRALFPNA